MCESRNYVPCVLLIRTGTNSVRDSLDVVSNLLVYPATNILGLRVLDAVLVTVVGVDLHG